MPIQVTNWLIQPEVGNRARVTLRDRDRALEIQDEQIRLVGDGYDLLGKERTGRVYDQAIGHLATEHRVTRERELHFPSRALDAAPM